MKRLILLAVAISFIAAMFYNVGSKNPVKISDQKETGTEVNRPDFRSTYVPRGGLDLTGSIPEMDGYYDYVTNGNNLHRIWKRGDTVIVSADQTDSASAQVSTARKSYYQFTVDNGVTWNSEALLVSADGNAYPDLNPVILSGARTVGITGRQFVSGARRGYVGLDVLLGAGSFTNNFVPSGAGSDNFGALVNGNTIACGWLGGGTADTIYKSNYDINTNTYSGTAPLWTGVPANARTFTAANGNGTSAIAYWFATAPTKLVYKQSTDGGVTYGSEQTIFTEGTVINGTALAPWFNADMIYKPGTSTPLMAFGTLLTGNFGTPGGYKLMFWSPAVNSGNALPIADYTNFPPMADTVVFGDRLRNLQVGFTAMSHPSLAYTQDGSRLFVVYSGAQLDTVNSTNYSADGSYNYNDIYVQYSDNDGATWSAPRNLTNTAEVDEIYPSVSRVSATATVIAVTYQLSECPGATSFTNTSTPICPVYQIYKQFDPVTGTVIGIQNISNEVPNGFSLSQNYPNPFNPVTKIRFAVPKSSNVTIEVFDVTGKLVATLAKDQAVTAGTKEVDFNAANLSSGVYFYSLKAGDFTQTKKMILVK